MKRTKVFNAAQLTEAFQRSKRADTFLVSKENGEQKRVYAAATFAGRKIAMRKIKGGWKATVLE
jgi:hypothetical protein